MLRRFLHECFLIWLLVVYVVACRVALAAKITRRVIAVIHTRRPIYNWITNRVSILFSSNLNAFVVVGYLLKCCTSCKKEIFISIFFYFFIKCHKMNHVAALRQQMGVSEMTKYALQMCLLDCCCSSPWNSTNKQASSYAKSFTGAKMCLVKRRWKRWKSH